MWLVSLILLSQIQIVRVKYDGGDWYNDPSIIPNLLTEFQKRTGIKTNKKEIVLKLDDDEIFYYPFLFITGHERINLSREEIENLRKYLYSGGFVYADDDYGMDEYFRRMVAVAFPESKLVLLPPDHEIYHCFYDLKNGLPKIHEHYKGPPEGYGLFLNGRLSLFYTYNSNISDGWADPDVHHDPPEKREEAFKMGVNILYYAITH